MMQVQFMKKITGKHGILTLLAILIAAAVLLAGILVVCDMAGGGNDESFVVEIPEGAGAKALRTF